MAKFSVAYVVLCEWLFALLAGGFGVVLELEAKTSREVLFASTFLAVAVISLAARFSLMRRRRWAWLVSMVFGVLVVGLGLWIVWSAIHADSHGDGGEAGIFGVGFVLFAGVGLILLNLPGTRRYIRGHDLAV